MPFLLVAQAFGREAVWQISAQRSIVSAPASVWSSTTPGCSAWS
jgi:hypothetical protein